MKKKAVVFLTLIPFIIAILAFVTTSFVIRKVEHDISDIAWKYEDNTAFFLAEGKQKLEAEPVFDEKYPLSDGNLLSWSTDNNEIATIEQNDDATYIIPKKEGKTTVSCFNEKKTVKKSFIATIVGDGGAIIANPVIPFSQRSLTHKKYVGLYDDTDSFDSKIANSYLDLNIEIKGGTLNKNEIRYETSDNIEFSLNDYKIKFLSSGDASLKLINPYSEAGSALFNFKILDAINIYNFDDLMNVTNKAKKPYPSVLRVNLESFNHTYKVNEKDKSLTKLSKDTELFGRLIDNKVCSFVDDVYKFETTYNHDFIDEWNLGIDNEIIKDASKISTDRLAGVYIQDDFYGNGFTINTHELVYPSDSQEIVVGGDTLTIPLLTNDDLFAGPLPFVSLGNPYFVRTDLKPIFALCGQDNAAFYIDNDDIILEDVHFKSCDFGSNLTNLQYSGTTLDINADNINISNSVIENGRNVIRSYSSNNLTIKNSLLRNGMEFLFRSGSNEYNHVNYDKNITYKGSNGALIQTSNRSYLKPISVLEINKLEKNYKADSILTNSALYNTQGNEFFDFELSDYSKQEYIDAVPSIIEAFSNTNNIIKENEKVYKGSAILDKVFFANSGISAISMDAMAQGSFIESNITSLFAALLGVYMKYMPHNLALTSYPTKVTIKGDTRFYDWKDKDNITFESLLVNDIAKLIQDHGGLGSDYNINITEDDFLPLKKILLDNHNEEIVSDSKINLPIYFQGGGTNLSDVFIDEEMLKNFTSKFELDPFIYSLDLKVDPTDHFNSDPVAKYGAMKTAMLRAASNVMGFNPYYIMALNNRNSKWINENPKIEDLELK